MCELQATGGIQGKMPVLVEADCIVQSWMLYSKEMQSLLALASALMLLCITLEVVSCSHRLTPNAWTFGEDDGKKRACQHNSPRTS